MKTSLLKTLLRWDASKRSLVYLPAVAGLLGLITLAAIAAQHQTAPTGSMTQGKVLVEVRFEGSYLQLEELATHWKADIQRYEPPRLYLVVEESVLPALRQEGYPPRIVDPEDFYQQLVRVEPATDEVLARVRNLGGRLVQREQAYAVVRVTLRQLKLLEAEEIEVRKIEEGELVARRVEIAVLDEESLALVVSTGVDIFEVKDGVVRGTAFDEQIETLRRQGLEVKVLPRPYQGPD